MNICTRAGNVFFAIAQRGQREGHSAQTIVDLRQERCCKHLGSQRLTGGADYLRRGRLRTLLFRRKRGFEGANVAQQLGLRLGCQLIDVADQENPIRSPAHGGPESLGAKLATTAPVGQKQGSRLFYHQHARGGVARLDVPCQQVFAGAGFSFNQSQPYPRTDLLQLLRHSPHGQRS